MQMDVCTLYHSAMHCKLGEKGGREAACTNCAVICVTNALTRGRTNICLAAKKVCWGLLTVTNEKPSY